MELFEQLGFSENPFSKFSAEEEYDILDRIYYKPRYFQSLLTDINSGHSRVIFGERGSGKTALLLYLKDELSSENRLTCLINDYEGIDLLKSDQQIMFKMIQSLISVFIVYLSKNPNELKSIDNNEKASLVFCLENYYKPLTKKEYDHYYNSLTKIKSKNTLKQIFNAIFQKPINYFISGSIEVISDAICKSLNLPKIETKVFYK